MTSIDALRSVLSDSISVSTDRSKSFFKTGIGDYAAEDEFIGVPVPVLRKIAKLFYSFSIEDIKEIISSKINEERLLALFILVEQYTKSDEANKELIYEFYMDNLAHVNNWNLVDSSAHLILGAHLYKRNRDILLNLSKSNTLWERRIAIVATLYFIRQGDVEWTFKIAEILLHDEQDLIHKAVGWMLRETYKKDKLSLLKFLDEHFAKMPRTMLRYAIEKLPEDGRKKYMLRSSKIKIDL